MWVLLPAGTACPPQPLNCVRANTYSNGSTMSAITVLGGAGGPHVSSGGHSLAWDLAEDRSADAVFVAPGDEIYVNMDAGFLKCAPRLLRSSIRISALRFADGSPVLTVAGVTARNWLETGCWPLFAAS